MKIKNPRHVPELREMLAAGDIKSIQKFCKSRHPASIAESISALLGVEAWVLLRHTDAPSLAEIFSHLDHELQVEIIQFLRRGEIAHM